MFGKLGPTEMIVILAILLIIFGPGKLPELAKSIGKSITELKDGLSGKTSSDSRNDTSSQNQGQSDTSQEHTS